MTETLLMRAPFQPIEVTEGWDAQLLEEAGKLIGYHPKALLEAKQTRERSLDENIFARVLEAVDIQPFTVQSVLAYKARMLKEAHKDESWRLTRYMHRSGRHEMQEGQLVVNAVGWSAWSIFAVALTACLLAHFYGYNAGWGWDGHKSIQLIACMTAATARLVMLLPTLAIAAWAVLLYLRLKSATAVTAQWRIHAVSYGYLAPIPAFAIQRMISLKKALPEVTFSVEQLDAHKESLNTEYREPLPPDPFLIATFRDISCYIDVWDEPKFEGRRTV